MKSAQENHKRYRERTKSISIYVKPEYYEDLSTYSKVNNISVRQIIIQSLTQYMKNHPV